MTKAERIKKVLEQYRNGLLTDTDLLSVIIQICDGSMSTLVAVITEMELAFRG